MPPRIAGLTGATLATAPSVCHACVWWQSRGTRRAVLCRTDLLVTRDPVRFEFALPHGSYATAVLREYLKSGPLSL